MKIGEFPGLTASEIERLALLSEEAGEVVQAVAKILRHGFTAHHPDGGPDNRNALEMEIGDLIAAIRFMYDNADVSIIRVEEAAREKYEKIATGKAYLHHHAARLAVTPNDFRPRGLARWQRPIATESATEGEEDS